MGRTRLNGPVSVHLVRTESPVQSIVHGKIRYQIYYCIPVRDSTTVLHLPHRPSWAPPVGAFSPFVISFSYFTSLPSPPSSSFSPFLSNPRSFFARSHSLLPSGIPRLPSPTSVTLCSHLPTPNRQHALLCCYSRHCLRGPRFRLHHTRLH